MSRSLEVVSPPRTTLGRLPRLHLPSIRGRAWADRGPLLLAAVVVALATLLASAVPPQVRKTADDAVKDAVVRAGANADIVVNAPFEREENPTLARVRQPGSAEAVDQSVRIARFRLGPGLAAVLSPPVASVTTTELRVTGNLPGRTFRLAYVVGGAIMLGSHQSGEKVRNFLLGAVFLAAAAAGGAYILGKINGFGIN